MDRIAYHQIREVLHKVKLIFHSKSNFKKIKWLVLQIFNGLISQMVPSGKKDPWWNFDWLINLEKQMGIRSSFYFLQKEDSKMDSQYKFKNKKIKRLISYIKKAGFEAGLHGPFYSYNNPGKLQQQVAEWTRHLGTPPEGIR